MIGTAKKKTIQFGILVFLETQKMNLRGNLQDAHLYENFFCFKKKFLPPLDPVVFSKHFYPRPRWCFAKLTLSYSTSDNETPPISWVLIGRPLIFCWLTSPRAVTRLENVRQSNIRGKKMGFQLSHKHPPFSLTLQPCSLDFLTPANTDFKKNVSFWVFCNSWKFARKRSIIKSFD